MLRDSQSASGVGSARHSSRFVSLLVSVRTCNPEFEPETSPPLRNWGAKLGVLGNTSPATATPFVPIDRKDTRCPVDGYSDVHEAIGVI